MLLPPPSPAQAEFLQTLVGPRGNGEEALRGFPFAADLDRWPVDG